ncbi:DUF4393 domain-containing protein [Cupriavidus plantarum]|uniref:Uncharacterized protein DUF4393 n=1 Tax=Cupriavidus plantarum TaxID=942865 RepID=A0A316F2L5_9BURK|nr:DUF4393 domain-containing protein [Cupriavidus plantarum]PWK38676.1 uncharacterized protein DUF4393 [Cupriavidus plantarum]
MGEENKEVGTVTEIAQAVAAVAKEVPVYQDAVQPAAQELGKGLVVVAKAVNACLIPVEGLVWGVEKIKDFVRERVAKKLENVPPDEIQQPKPHVAVPAIEALRYTGIEESLSDLYANLLATSMDKATAYRAHPGFVDIIKNMCPDEAKVMKYLVTVRQFIAIANINSNISGGGGYNVMSRNVTSLGARAGCQHPGLLSTYLDNLARLGLIAVDYETFLTDPKAYEEIENAPAVKKILEQISQTPGRTGEIKKGIVKITDLGEQFGRVCILDKDRQPRD